MRQLLAGLRRTHDLECSVDKIAYLHDVLIMDLSGRLTESANVLRTNRTRRLKPIRSQASPARRSPMRLREGANYTRQIPPAALNAPMPGPTILVNRASRRAGRVTQFLFPNRFDQPRTAVTRPLLPSTLPRRRPGNSTTNDLSRQDKQSHYD